MRTYEKNINFVYAPRTLCISPKTLLVFKVEKKTLKLGQEAVLLYFSIRHNYTM